MPSVMEALPFDLLYHIAYALAMLSPEDPMRDLHSLRQASPTFWAMLQHCNATHLYSLIFRSVYDMGARLRRYRYPSTNSGLTMEFFLRQRTVRRAQMSDFCSEFMERDLWTGVQMMMEDDGRNERLLSRVQFAEFVLGIGRRNGWFLGEGHVEHHTPLQYLVIWLLYLVAPLGTSFKFQSNIINESSKLYHKFLFINSPKTSARRWKNF